MTAPTLSVARARPEDAPLVAPLFDAYRQFYGKPADEALALDFVRERLARGESIILLALGPGGEAAGFTQLYPSFSSTRARRLLVLNDLYVRDDWRRRGVATRLLEAARALGAAEGCVCLTLATAEDNHAAQRLYESLGWRRDGWAHYELPLTD